jgi:hypothetical protein
MKLLFTSSEAIPLVLLISPHCIGAHVVLCRTKNTTNIELVGEEHYLCKVEFPKGDHKKRIHDGKVLSFLRPSWSVKKTSLED